MGHRIVRCLLLLCYGALIFTTFLVLKTSAATDLNPLRDDGDLYYWGTYRPYPYVGLRCQSPDSPLLGIMWYKPSLTVASAQSSRRGQTRRQPLHSILRHECSYDDQLDAFGWMKHDGRGFGAQNIVDPSNQVNLTMQWVKPRLKQNPDEWVLRIQGSRIVADAATTNESSSFIDDDEDSDVSLLWYVSTPTNLTATWDWNSSSITGVQPDRGRYRVFMKQSPNNIPARYPKSTRARQHEYVSYNATYSYAIQVEPSVYYNPKPWLLRELANPMLSSSLPSHLFNPGSLYRAATPRSGNQIVKQVFLSLPFATDLHFSYDSGDNKKQISDYDWDSVTFAIRRADKEFDTKFADRFVDNHSFSSELWLGLSSSQATRSLADRQPLAAWSHDVTRTAKYALGNMLGSITYMHGQRQVYQPKEDKIMTSKAETEMVVIVPDRPDHAQGYLWDEGFHQHLVSLWDFNWTIRIMSSWWNQTDPSTGWIARQQILNGEVQWGARPTSWPQVPGTANPPSHHLLLESLLDRAILSPSGSDSSDDDETVAKDSDSPHRQLQTFFQSIWMSFQVNVKWYLHTQVAKVGPNLFRWAGRTQDYCLPSGMDDYPRAPILTDEEAHLDLQVWMLVSTRSIAKVARFLNKPEVAKHYQDLHINLTKALMDNFWDQSNLIFDEFYYDENGTKVFNGHFGYLNFFPIFLNVIPSDVPEFEIMMRELLDRDNGIWTRYGLRSLSSNDPYYGHGDNYWTSPIWLNINYLAVSSMYKYSHGRNDDYPMDAELRKEIYRGYQELRSNLIAMVVDSYVSTSYIWEVYDGDTGRGMDNHPFTGWSALVVNIMAEQY